MKKLALLYITESFMLFCMVSMGLFNTQNDIYSIFVTALFFVEFFAIGILKNSHINENMLIVFVLLFLAFAARYGYILLDDSLRISSWEWAGDPQDFRESAIKFFYTNKARFRSLDFDTTTLYLGIITKIYDPQRMFIRYFNTLSFMLSALLIYDCMCKFCISSHTKNLLIFWMLFTPQNIRNTTVSNREGYIQLLLAMAMAAFLSYVEKRQKRYFTFAIVTVLIACGLHSGCMALLFGFVFFLIFSNRTATKYQLQAKSIILFLAVFVAFFILYIQFGDIFFSKFGNIESVGDISSKVLYNDGGGSDYYIPGGNTTTAWGLLLASPLRMIYFLLSPMPWYWRGVTDVLAFVATSVPQIVLIWYTFRLLPKMQDGKNKTVVIALVISAFCTALIFGWGCKNAGTAIRHRDKFLSLYVMILAILLNAKNEKRKVIWPVTL